MSVSDNTWVIVLAAGDGRRLSRLTTIESGLAVPKQFCSLSGGYSLLEEALRRAAAVAVPRRVCCIVADQHRRWWEPALAAVPVSNIIVQPRNCGTANGILLPLIHIMRADPRARVVLLPSDHHVDDERALAVVLRRAIRQIDAASAQILLLGMTPDQPDPELGYIVPSRRAQPVSGVERFVEKPAVELAGLLIEHGALWNSFIIAARGAVLMELFERRFPQLVDDMRGAVLHDLAAPGGAAATTHLYQTLADIDFSRDVIEGMESVLGVMPVPFCGWSDLGTPTRLAETLQRLPRRRGVALDPSGPAAGCLNLAAQHARLQALGDPSIGLL